MRKIGARSKCRGLTLLEALVYVALWTLVALSTMRVLGDGRMIRAKARHRAAMLWIAQEELERARAVKASDLRQQRITRTDVSWPSGTEAIVETSPRDDGTWLVDVRVQRATTEGSPVVHLATIRAGAVR